jgi:hypothetical protein
VRHALLPELATRRRFDAHDEGLAVVSDHTHDHVPDRSWRMGRNSALRQASERPDGADDAIGMLGVRSRAGSGLDAHATACSTTVNPIAARPPRPDRAAAALTAMLFMDTPLSDA